MDDEKRICDYTKKVTKYFNKLVKPDHLFNKILNTPIEMEMSEKVNKINATYILFLREKFIKEFSLSNNTNKDHTNKSINIEGIREYLYDILQNKGELPIKYKYSNGNKLGRIFTTHHSLQRLPSNIKNYITSGIYEDLDIINAHPTIIKLLADIAEIQTPTLTEYINNRNDFLDSNYLTKKDIIIRGCYTDGIDNDASGKERQLYEDIRKVRDFYYNEKELRYVFGLSDRELDNIKKELSITKKGRPKTGELEAKAMLEKKLTNKKSSFLSQLLGYIENKIVNYAVTKNNLSMSVNFFDGFLIEKDKVETAMLNETTKEIGIKWSKKPMCYKIEEGRDEFNYKNCMVFNEYKEIFERTQFIIEHPYQIITLNGGENGAHLSTNPEHFKHSHSNITVQLLCNIGTTVVKEIKPCKFINAWLDDPNRRSYKKSVYIPYTCFETPDILVKENYDIKDSFNLFNGFDRTYIPKEDRIGYEKEIDFIVNDFILKLICSDDKEKHTYLMGWVAHMFQKPRELPEIAICLFAKQGSGKGRFCALLKSLLQFKSNTNHSYTSNGKPKDTVFCRFNSCISNKLFIELNEFTNRDYIACVNELKTLITDNRKSIERKNIDGCIQEYNFSRLVLAADNERPMSLTTSERRYFVTNLSQEWKQKTQEYKYGKLSKLIEDNDFMNHLFSYIMDWDISNFVTGAVGCPATEEQSQLVGDNIKPIYHFLKEKFIDRYDLYKKKFQFVKHWNRTGVIIENSRGDYTILKQFKQWLKNNGYQKESNWNNERLRHSLRDAIGVYGYEYQWSHRLGDSKKTTTCVFFSLDEMRDEINRIMPFNKTSVTTDDKIDVKKIVTSKEDEYTKTDSDDEEVENKKPRKTTKKNKINSADFL